MKRVVFSILVDNTSGVLSRIAGLFSRRGYNIDSLTVGRTADDRYSRATVVANGDEIILQQIENERPGSPYAYSVVTVQICQNYTPGDSAFGGTSFQEASLGTMLSGSGCTIKVMPY